MVGWRHVLICGRTRKAGEFLCPGMCDGKEGTGWPATWLWNHGSHPVPTAPHGLMSGLPAASPAVTLTACSAGVLRTQPDGTPTEDPPAPPHILPIEPQVPAMASITSPPTWPLSSDSLRPSHQNLLFVHPVSAPLFCCSSAPVLGPQAGPNQGQLLPQTCLRAQWEAAGSPCHAALLFPRGPGSPC